MLFAIKDSVVFTIQKEYVLGQAQNMTTEQNNKHGHQPTHNILLNQSSYVSRSILIIIMTLPPEDQRLKGYSVCIFYAGYYEDYLLRTLFLLLLPEDQRV